MTPDYGSQTTTFTFDVTKSPLFQKDQKNYINILGVKQLNSLKNVSLLDIFLSNGNVVEPHYHPNAAELVYCISGSVHVAMLNPYTKQFQTYSIGPSQVVNIPQGWWHYEVATSDNTHLLAIFNASTPEVVLGSDLLKFTPAPIMAHTYCIDLAKWKSVISSITPTMYIGPPNHCPKHSPTQPTYSTYYPYSNRYLFGM
ncbi:MAG: cupin domain-containing protein [Anoxybacillus sp.]|nr:cupin domain-containing protein [Anoxybacillus sp.]MCL6586733.1 cupin domain-containing protein [Anoxybacillus sp.]